MKVISLLNLKGGVGKTTTAINLAKGLANQNHKVLLIDTDMQSNATLFFLEEKMMKDDYKNISELLLDNKPVVNDYIYNVGHNLDIIGSHLKLSNAELMLKSDFSRNQTTVIKSWLKQINYDYVIIDCAPTISLLTVNAIMASDEIIIPIKIEYFALQGYQTTKENIELIKNGYDVDVNYSVLFTMVNRNNIDRSVIENIEEIKYINTIRNQPKPITLSSFDKVALIDGKASSVQNDYQNFINEFLEREALQ